ncbi:MAG: hypothetical protein KA319_04995 [Ferruginibacter sp.]|nr:hypothetical protein [Ferruginibacter sp.]
MFSKLNIYKDDVFSQGVIFVFILLSIVIAPSCSSNINEREKIEVKNESPKEQKKLSVKYIGEAKSGKSYAFLMTPTMSEAEKDKAFKRVQKSNPYLDYEVYSSQDSNLVAAFERIGLIKNSEILLSKFKSTSDSLTSFIDSRGDKILLYYYDNQTTQHLHFKLYNTKDTIDIDTQSFSTQKLDYVFLDIIPGGNKELVFLDDWHISNNDRFHFKVYEIKTY